MSWKLSGLKQRQPRALVVGLRRIVKDPKASVRQRLRACELLAIIAGYIEGHSQAEAETGAVLCLRGRWQRWWTTRNSSSRPHRCERCGKIHKAQCCNHYVFLNSPQMGNLGNFVRE